METLQFHSVFGSAGKYLQLVVCSITARCVLIGETGPVCRMVSCFVNYRIIHLDFLESFESDTNSRFHFLLQIPVLFGVFWDIAYYNFYIFIYLFWFRNVSLISIHHRINEDEVNWYITLMKRVFEHRKTMQNS